MYHIIINPASKSGRGIKLWKKLEPVFSSRDIKYRMIYSEYPGHIVKIVARRALTLEGLTADADLHERLKTGKGRYLKSQGLNLSLYNVLCRGNDLAYRVKVYENRFYYHHVTFLTVVLPSISYYCSF